MVEKNKDKLVKEITSMDENFSQWYTDVVSKTELVDYSPVKGFMVIRPYGYAIWENIQAAYDKRFKETGHKNMYFPLLIPESLLNKEAQHVEGFAPEVAWVTHGGNRKLEERLCVRPTSETIICSMYSKWLHTYRQLPYLYNQWCSVVRWEKTTRPFLRTSEFLWQEGHTLHETPEEAQEETMQMINIYREVAENVLAMPVVVGLKSEKEKFAGADKTYTMEALMHDGQALQSGTSHNLGQNFTKAFDIQYLDRNNEQTNPYHTSWGVSTRLIGGIIMVHGDDKGLNLPPAIAPIQVVVLPIAQHKEGVLDKAYEIKKALETNFRVEIDDSDNSPGWKFNQWEMKGVPIRLEIGPRDIKNNQCILARRDTGEKIAVPLDELETTLKELLDAIQQNLFDKALKMREEKTSVALNMTEFEKNLKENPGFIKAMWCGDETCEDSIKEETGATLRCIPLEDEQEILGEGKCVCCDKPADKMAYFARAY
ncbi:MAG: proline--tRNA ligase [Eubacteriaceae bacterium]|jgi:prolyl-tRNA synthetase|nr:proline--tRNA ligase [Eubacteriaceae bacterium]